MRPDLDVALAPLLDDDAGLRQCVEHFTVEQLVAPVINRFTSSRCCNGGLQLIAGWTYLSEKLQTANREQQRQ